jgi:hypothetical protein
MLEPALRPSKQYQRVFGIIVQVIEVTPQELPSSTSTVEVLTLEAGTTSPKRHQSLSIIEHDIEHSNIDGMRANVSIGRLQWIGAGDEW